MSVISGVGCTVDLIPISGVGEGQGNGTIIITWKGKTVRLVHLTIEEQSSVASREPMRLVAGRIPGGQWLALQTNEGPVFLERVSLECAIRKAFSEIEPHQTATVIEEVFKGALVRDPSPRSEIYPRAQSDCLRVALQGDIGVIVAHAEGLSPHEQVALRIHLTEQVTMAVDWVERRLPHFLDSLSWATCDWVKIPEFPFPAHCFRESKTGKIRVDITPGVIELGGSKRIKSVIRLQGGEIVQLVRAAPLKISPLRKGLSPKDMASMQSWMRSLTYEARVSEELIRGHVPNVISIMRECYDKEGEKKYRYMMERCKVDLQDYVGQRIRNLNWDCQEQLKPYLQKIIYIHLLILDTLRHMHALHWVHKDLKPENILLQNEGIRVTDFGFSRREGEPPDSRGSPMYSAPEVFFRLEEATVSPATDMWAFGIMLYNGTHRDLAPFSNIHEMLYQKIRLHHQKINTIVEKQKSERAADADQEKRVRESSELQTEFEKEICSLFDELFLRIESFRDTLKEEATPLEMLIWDLIAITPTERPTAEQAYQRLARISQGLKLGFEVNNP